VLLSQNTLRVPQSVLVEEISSATPVSPTTAATFYPNMLPAKTGYEPCQTDGPTWKKDKVGFRHYFDGRNSKDLFGKRGACQLTVNRLKLYTCIPFKMDV